MKFLKWNPVTLLAAIIVSSLGFAISSGQAEAEEWQTVTTSEEAFRVGYFQVVGISDSGQSRYRAMRAATVVAQRDLLEQVQGVRVQGETTVADGMLQSDIVRTQIKGFLKGAKSCGKKYDSSEKYGSVCLRLNLKGPGGIYDDVFNTMKAGNMLPGMQNQPMAPMPTLPPPSVNMPAGMMIHNDGVIIQTGSVFKPAIVNRILNEKGDILFDPSKVVNAILVERGAGGFTGQLSKAKGLLASWGSSDPMIVKAISTRQGTDVVLGMDDSAKMFAADQKTSFLSQAKVVFVIN